MEALRSDSAKVFDSARGSKKICEMLRGDGSIFAARWSFDRLTVSTGNLSAGIVVYRVGGTAPVVRNSRGKTVRRRPLIGSISYVCPDTSAVWQVEGPCEACHVYVPEEQLREFAGKDCNGEDLTPAIRDFFAIEDPWLKGYFQMVLAELELSPDSHSSDSLFITQAELLIVGRLVRHYSRGAKQAEMPIEKRRTNPLRSATLRRIEDYVDANLAGDIALRDLANMACMSVGHFLRAFRASSGTTPYHYVLTRRLFRARAMLNASCLPIAEVAQECGFKTASHLSSKFHASFGASPSQYRALRARASA